jgi:hypothetical protein
VNPRVFGAIVFVGALVRAAALPLPGTRDTIPWRIWSYNAANEGVARLYGVGGSPPEWRTLTYLNAEGQATYPPLALHELGLAGRVYRRLEGGQFPNTTPIFLAIKSPAILSDIGLAILLYFAVGRKLGTATARWAAAVYWLNPGIILDGAALGYLDPQFMLPAAGSLVAAVSGWGLSAGALGAAAALTKPQAAILGPAIVLALWNNHGDLKTRLTSLAAAVGGAGLVTLAVCWSVFAEGGGPNLIQALGRLEAHDMLSGNACNLWWIVGYIVRAIYSIEDYGRVGAFVHQTQILQISRFMEVGGFNPRPIGAALTIAAMAWALWRGRTGKDLWLMAGLSAFLVHAYAVLSAQVHENHLFAAVPLLVLAAAGRSQFTPILVAVSSIFTLNLNIFYGISEDIGYAIPRSVTVIDLSVVLSFINCGVLVWHGFVLRRETAAA